MKFLRWLTVLAVLISLLVVPGAAGNAVTDSKTIRRAHLVNGAEQVVDERTFTVSVDQTTHLRDRQEINVSWTGGHPTGGIVGDSNSGAAAEQEYPVVLMQCRGVDRSDVPEAQRLSPETCWTKTPYERSQSQNFIWPAFRLDRYAAAADRKRFVGVPSPLPPACQGLVTGSQHWTAFRGADGTVYGGGPPSGAQARACAGAAPESATYEDSLQPSNTTYGISDTDGKGTAQFAVAAAESHGSLGCSQKVTCSLVIVPIMGISCDPAAESLPPEDRPPADTSEEASRQCSATGRYKPGEFAAGTGDRQSDLAVAGQLWWSASNWRNRLSVPLEFAQAGNICDLLNHQAPVHIYGSELMGEATLQWSPRFCLDSKLFKLKHVRTAEPQAKNLVDTGAIEGALIGGPPQEPFARPIVQAPAAVTGFAVVYSIDDKNGHAMRELKLTPRLLAKLITMSYPAAPAIQGPYDELQKNPLTMGVDPEFQALNPGPPPPGYNTQPASTLFMISSDSDVIWALTSYIKADREAREWLNGKPDPWGMVVNPHYKGIKLPVFGWPLLDTFANGVAYEESINPCLASSQPRVPYLPLVAAPVSQFAIVTLNMQFGIANSQIICRNAGEETQRLVAIGREKPGQRFLVGLTSLADVDRYQLDAASLQTSVSSSAPEKFSDDTGRGFVAPSEDSLREAARMLKADESAGTWIVPYDELKTNDEAYPGTMLMSVAVPTKGLNKTTAQRFAQFLRFVASSGQKSGFGNGQLPPGYLPMTAANGLAAQVRYTQVAATDVAAQSGGVPSVITFKTARPSSPGGEGPGLSGAPPPGISGPVTGPGVAPLVSPPSVTGVIGLAGKTTGVGSDVGAWLFPLALLVAAMCAIGATLAWFFGRRTAGAHE